jgi:hypothetical protein
MEIKKNSAPSFAIKGGPDTWFNLGKEIKRLPVVS